MSARDELAEVISNFRDDWYKVARKEPAGIDRDEADAILDAGYTKPRTVTTAEELDALAEGSVILSDEGGIFEALEAWNRDESEYGRQWIETGTSWRLESPEICLPATVLYEPTA